MSVKLGPHEMALVLVSLCNGCQAGDPLEMAVKLAELLQAIKLVRWVGWCIELIRWLSYAIDYLEEWYTLDEDR
jgi:hypothetical protein